MKANPHRRELRSELAKERAGLLAGQIEASAEEKTRLWGFHTSYSGYLKENTPLKEESRQVRHLRLVTDASGAGVGFHAYYPFGEEITPVDQNTLPLKFTGHERDFYKEGAADEGDDLDYMHARYCSPFAGRFLSVDPVAGKRRVPQSWNRYSYVRNNPINYFDPDGTTERKGFRAGTVRNNSDTYVWIVADKNNRTVVVKLKPGERSTKYFEDTDAVIIDPRIRLDGRTGGAYKIGTQDIDIEEPFKIFGSKKKKKKHDLVLDLDNLEFIPNWYNDTQGFWSPGQAEGEGWVVPSEASSSSETGETEDTPPTDGPDPGSENDSDRED